MTSLNIKDLHVAEELNAKAMSAVRGGTMFNWPGFDQSKYNVSLTAQQMIGQTQNTSNANGNNVAFASCIDSTVAPSQSASNTNSIKF
jgi:hypothetical protein